MSKIDAYRLNVQKIENGNRIDIGGIAGVVSIIQDFSGPSSFYTSEVRLEVISSQYKGAWILPALAFIFGKGLVTNKLLMRENKYFGMDFGYRGRYLTLDKDRFDKTIFKKITDRLTSLDRSKSRKKRIEKLKLTNALKAYNDALLLHLNRVNEYAQSEQSYLNFYRILDMFAVGDGAWDFADKTVSELSAHFIKTHYQKMRRVGLYKRHHIHISENIYKSKRQNLTKKVSNISIYDQSKAHRTFLVLLFSLYQFRNKWLHNGFPFPSKQVSVKCNASRYFGFSVGESLPLKDWHRGLVHNRLNYISYEDLLQEIAPSSRGRPRSAFDKLYLLWPTWYFLNDIVRELLNHKLEI